MENSELRYTPVTVPAGVGAYIELDISRIVSLFVMETLSWGTADGEVSIAFGDMGEAIPVAAGDCFLNFSPVKRIKVINNTSIAAKTVVLLLTTNSNFRYWIAARGL